MQQALVFTQSTDCSLSQSSVDSIITAAQRLIIETAYYERRRANLSAAIIQVAIQRATAEEAQSSANLRVK